MVNLLRKADSNIIQSEIDKAEEAQIHRKHPLFYYFNCCKSCKKKRKKVEVAESTEKIQLFQTKPLTKAWAEMDEEERKTRARYLWSRVKFRMKIMTFVKRSKDQADKKNHNAMGGIDIDEVDISRLVDSGDPMTLNNKPTKWYIIK